MNEFKKIDPLKGLNKKQVRFINITIVASIVALITFVVGLLMMLYAILIFNHAI